MESGGFFPEEDCRENIEPAEPKKCFKEILNKITAQSMEMSGSFMEVEGKESSPNKGEGNESSPNEVEGNEVRQISACDDEIQSKLEVKVEDLDANTTESVSEEEKSSKLDHDYFLF